MCRRSVYDLIDRVPLTAIIAQLHDNFDSKHHWLPDVLVLVCSNIVHTLTEGLCNEVNALGICGPHTDLTLEIMSSLSLLSSKIPRASQPIPHFLRTR